MEPLQDLYNECRAISFHYKFPDNSCLLSVVILLLFLAECLCFDFNCFDLKQLVEIVGRW